MKYEPHRYSPKLGPLEKHHRKCKSNGGSNEPQNISWVPEKLHKSYHQLFRNATPKEVCDELNENWIDKDYIVIAIQKEDLAKIEEVLYKLNTY